MNFKLSTIRLLSLLLIAVTATAASIRHNDSFKNLQVLPKDISEKKLDSLMDVYCKALHVSCDFCHSKAKDMFSVNTASDKLDFAEDNSMKDNARKMIRMTMDINKSNFNYDSSIAPIYLNIVSCNTCHRGNPFPMNE